MCVCVCAYNAGFYELGRLFARNDAEGMRKKKKLLLFFCCLFCFFFSVSPAPHFSLPLCVHTVQTAREEEEGWRRGLEGREEESF